jgi:hypothetical protein
LGTNFSSSPGSGAPMQPAPSSFQCAEVMAGEVSVAPHEVVSQSGRAARTRRATASSRCQVEGASAAAA